MIRSRKMLKRVATRRHPCLTPTVVLNYFPMLPFIWTALVAAQWFELEIGAKYKCTRAQKKYKGDKNFHVLYKR